MGSKNKGCDSEHLLLSNKQGAAVRSLLKFTNTYCCGPVRVLYEYTEERRGGTVAAGVSSLMEFIISNVSPGIFYKVCYILTDLKVKLTSLVRRPGLEILSFNLHSFKLDFSGGLRTFPYP